MPFRDHPPTLAGALSALLGSLSQDLWPLIAQSPLSERTASLAVTIFAGIAGGLIGRLTERWTVPFRYNLHDGPDEDE